MLKQYDKDPSVDAEQDGLETKPDSTSGGPCPPAAMLDSAYVPAIRHPVPGRTLTADQGTDATVGHGHRPPAAIWSPADKCVACVGSDANDEPGRLAMRQVRWALAKASIAEIDTEIREDGTWCIAIDSEALDEADAVVRAAWEFAHGGPRHRLRRAAKQLRQAHRKRRVPAPPKAEERRVRRTSMPKRMLRRRGRMGIGVASAGMGD